MNELTELGKMTTNELVAYRNILLMGSRCLQVTDDPQRNDRHLKIVEGLLTERSVSYEPGKRLQRVG